MDAGVYHAPTSQGKTRTRKPRARKPKPIRITWDREKTRRLLDTLATCMWASNVKKADQELLEEYRSMIRAIYQMKDRKNVKAT